MSTSENEYKNAVENWYEHSELAMAAYAVLWSEITDVAYRDALVHKDVGMTAAQAAEFAKKWRVIDQYTAPAVSVPLFGEITGSGFSATVFERLDAEGKPTGDYVFAVRGTESGNMNDLLRTDVLGIGYDGFALRQAIDMYNYVQSLKADKNASYDALYLEFKVAA